MCPRCHRRSGRCYLVSVRADLGDGCVGLVLDSTTFRFSRETRDRIRAALVNSGLAWPNARITVTVSPRVSAYHLISLDLAVAVAIAAAAGDIPQPASDVVLTGELGLDGTLRPGPPWPMPQSPGIRSVITDRATAANTYPGVHVTGLTSLAEVAGWLRITTGSD